MNNSRKFCESCGMPMDKDTQKGGTNADGSKNENYCSYCYQSGEFTFQGNVNEFQNHCKEQMIKGGSSRFMAWLLTRNMKRLERWKS